MDIVEGAVVFLVVAIRRQTIRALGIRVDECKIYIVFQFGVESPKVLDKAV